MTKEERLAAISAILDILAARAASTSGQSPFGGGGFGGPATIPIDPNLNTPMPISSGGGDQQLVNDPDGVLAKIQHTKVDMPADSQKPSASQPTTAAAKTGDSQGDKDGGKQGDEDQTGASGKDEDKGEGNTNLSGNSTDNSDQAEPGATDDVSGNLSDDSNDFSNPDELGDESGLSSNSTKPDDLQQLSQDYKDAWNAVMTKYDQDEISPELLELLIAQIKSGIMKI